MSHLFWLDEEHLKRIGYMFPKPPGVKRADDRRVLSGIIHVIRKNRRSTVLCKCIPVEGSVSPALINARYS
jgi:hypothetical protein